MRLGALALVLPLTSALVPTISRRCIASSTTLALLTGQPRPAGASRRPACGDIETCRAEGERKEAERQAATPTVRLGDGVSYKETSRGSGDAIVAAGDVLQLTFTVYTGSGGYVYSLPSKEPGVQASKERDDLDSLRIVVGKTPPDVPVAVERALLGARQGATRLIEVVPRLGFETSDWEPAPSGFSGRQRMERYRALLAGNGLQPGYNAVLLFEATVQRIRKPS
jgi:hypothetical protein